MLLFERAVEDLPDRGTVFHLLAPGCVIQ
jgi:hypothetical protein